MIRRAAYFLKLKRVSHAPAQTTNVVIAPMTAPTATNNAPVIEYAVPMTARPMPPMNPTNRMTPASEPLINSLARNGKRQNCRQEVLATVADVRKSALINVFMINRLATYCALSKKSCSHGGPGVGSDFAPSRGTGGGPNAQERTEITFPKDDAA